MQRVDSHISCDCLTVHVAFLYSYIIIVKYTHACTGNITVVREIFVVQKFHVNFSRVKFSFSGPSTKIYHRVQENLSCTKTRWMSTEELCVFVAIALIVKSGRQLLDNM